MSTRVGLDEAMRAVQRLRAVGLERPESPAAALYDEVLRQRAEVQHLATAEGVAREERDQARAQLADRILTGAQVRELPTGSAVVQYTGPDGRLCLPAFSALLVDEDQDLRDAFGNYPYLSVEDPCTYRVLWAGGGR